MKNLKARKIETEAQAYDFALKKLSYRDYSEKAMASLLSRNQCPEIVKLSTLQKLKDYSFLNDASYADKVYAGWLNKKVYGRKHLVVELQKREVDALNIARILDVYNDDLEYERACQALNMWQRQHNRNHEPLVENLLAKAVRSLLSKGFSGILIQKALNGLDKNN